MHRCYIYQYTAAAAAAAAVANNAPELVPGSSVVIIVPVLLLKTSIAASTTCLPSAPTTGTHSPVVMGPSVAEAASEREADLGSNTQIPRRPDHVPRSAWQGWHCADCSE